MDQQAYAVLVKRESPPSKSGKTLPGAFCIGGLICAFGQLLYTGYAALGWKETTAKLMVSVTLIALTTVLTGFGIFGRIARVAGAGTLVPITGFANAMVSPAIEYKEEGYVLGVGANLFKIAGPVIAYGTAAGVLYGVVLWLITQIGG